jgi:hypothetical protein
MTFFGEATLEATGHHDFLGNQSGGDYRWPSLFFTMREGALLETTLGAKYPLSI